MLEGVTKGEVLTILTLVFTFLGSMWKDSRNRKWLEKDSEIKKKEIIDLAEAKAEALLIESRAIAKALRIKARKIALQVSEDLHKVSDDSTQHLALKIDEAKKAADNAFQEANDVNGKIKDVSNDIKELNSRLLTQESKPSEVVKE